MILATTLVFTTIFLGTKKVKPSFVKVQSKNKKFKKNIF